MTRSLSSNLLKRGFTQLVEEDARVINTNDLVAKRIRELAAKMQQDEGTGFISGLAADKVEALVTDTGDGEENPQTSGNVIKAGEDLQKLKEEAEAEAQKIIEDAKAKAESILADARAQAEAQKADALEQARRQGQQEAKAEAERAEAQRAAEYQKKAAGLDAEYQKRMDELEPQFVDTITATMRKTEDNRSFLVHVSKEDYPYVSMQKKQIMAGATAPNSTVEIVEDMTLGKGECMIETESGIFDCGLGTQLSELRQKLKLLSYEG